MLTTSGTLSINYMFWPLIGQHKVVFNLSSNCTIYVVCFGGGGDADDKDNEISFTTVSGINSNFNRMVAIIDSIDSFNYCDQSIKV